MKYETKAEIVSIFQTLVSVFVGQLAVMFAVAPVDQVLDGTVFTWNFLISAAIAAFRAAVKAVTSKYIPVTLGGKKE